MTNPNWQIGHPEALQSYYLPLPLDGKVLGWQNEQLVNTDVVVPPPVNTTDTWGGTAGGAPNAITLTPATPLLSYVAGSRFTFIAISANTGATTVQISGLAAIDLRTKVNIPLADGEVQPGIVDIEYDGTVFRLLSVDTFVQPSTFAVQRTAQDKSRERVSFGDFGAAGGGVTDETLLMQAAIDANPGKIIEGVPGKTYRITDSLLITTDFTKLDFRWSTLHLDDPSGLKSHVKIGFQAARINANAVERCIFTRQQVATAGAAIETDLTGITDVINCRIYGNNRIYRGVKMHRTIAAFIAPDVYIDNCIHSGIYTTGTDLSANACNDIHIHARWISGGQYGIYIWDFCQGFYIDLAAVYDNSVACISIAASAAGNAGVSFKIRNTDMDTGSIGLYLEHHDAVQVNGAWFSNLSTCGAIIKSTATNVIIQGCQNYPAGTGTGFELGGSGSLISNNIIAGGGIQINVKSTAVRSQINGNTLTSGQYGIYAAENPVDCNIVGNLIKDQSISPIADAATPNSRFIADNDGDSAIGTGAFFAVGASPWTAPVSGYDRQIVISAGTFSTVVMGGVNLSNGNAISFVCPRQKTFTITHTAAPFVSYNFI